MCSGMEYDCTWFMITPSPFRPFYTASVMFSASFNNGRMYQGHLSTRLWLNLPHSDFTLSKWSCDACMYYPISAEPAALCGSHYFRESACIVAFIHGVESYSHFLAGLFNSVTCLRRIISSECSRVMSTSASTFAHYDLWNRIYCC